VIELQGPFIFLSDQLKGVMAALEAGASVSEYRLATGDLVLEYEVRVKAINGKKLPRVTARQVSSLKKGRR
jgi:hypothetical protein